MSASVSAPSPWRRGLRTASATPLTRLLYLVQIAGFAAVYYAVAKVGLSAGALTGNVTPVWPPTGLALAALVLFGYRLWPGVFLGALLVNGLGAVPLGAAFGMATGNTLEAVVGAYLLVSVARFRPTLERVRDVIALAGLAALAGAVVSATFGVVSLRLGGVIPGHVFWGTWRVWWVGDALGVLVVAPALLAWARSSKLEDSARARFEGAAVVVTVVGSTVIAFSGPFDFPYLVFPALLWAALRFRQRGAATATLVVSSIAVARTIAGFGPFAGGSTTNSLWTLDVFLAVVALTGLVLAAVVSERDHADQRHARSEDRFRALVESAPDAMICVAPDGVIAIVNAQAECLFGYDRSDLVGQLVEMLVPEYAHAAHPHHRSSYVVDPHTGPIRTGMQVAARRRVGSEFPAEISLATITIDGDALDLVAVRDVSEQREASQRLQAAHRELDMRAQELDRSNHDLAAFAYVASHDLKEPLRAVRGFSQLLARDYKGRLDAQADEYLDFVDDGASRMQSLIDALLTYSQVGAETDLQTFPLRAAVDDALANLQSAIAPDARIDVDELPDVIADPGQVTQLLQNLVGNALKFRGEAPSVVRVAAEPEGDGWIISVTDNGIGIDPRFADQIFTVFQRLQPRDEYPGTGIGLAICKKLVERWGGRIWVESEPDAGATLRFTIPGQKESVRA